MAAKELNVRKVDEIKRLKKLGFGKRKIARTLNIHRDTVTKYFEENSPSGNDNKDGPLQPSDAWAGTIDWQDIREQMERGISLNVIHDEMLSKNLVSIQYPAFWKQLQKRAPSSTATMVRIFAPGSRIEIDYCDGIDLVNTGTGEVIKTEFFVGVLCNSRYTFAEFTMSQKSEDFLSSHVRMFNFFDGCSQLLSPDNLKSAVTKAHRYDPVINPAYTRLATHYGVAVVPARVKRPQDKAIVERTIQIFQRWFFICVRNRTFRSLQELNQCLKEYLEIFNNRKHRVFGKSRKEMFENEKPHLIPLPATDYQVSTYSRAKLSRDCHLSFEQNYYSAPYKLRGLDLEIWASPTTVEIYHGGERVAFHGRCKTTHKFVTDPKHYPPGQEAYADEDIQKLKSWAASIGVETSTLVEDLFSGTYPLKNLRRVQGILGLSKKYSREKLEAAAMIANEFDQKTIQYLERVIKNNQSGIQQKGEDKITREDNPNLRGIDEILLH
jgi:transposase